MRRLGAAFGGASKILAQTPMVYQKRAKNTVLTVRAMNEQKTNTHVYEQKRTFRAPKKQKKNVPTRGERSAALARSGENGEFMCIMIKKSYMEDRA